MVHSSLSSFAVVSLSVAASLLETFPYERMIWKSLSHLSPSSTALERMIWKSRGSESFRDFSISSFQWSIPLSSFAVVSIESVAASLLETFPYHPFNGPFLSHLSPSSPLSVARGERSGMDHWKDDMEKSLKAVVCQRGSESFRDFSISSFQLSIPLWSFAVVSLSVAASLLEAFPYHPFNGPFLSHLSPSSPWAWQRVF